MKKLLLLAMLSNLSFANIYNLKPIEITKDITCVIGDFNPPKKSNKGFVSNICYINLGDKLVALDAGPTYNFAKEFYKIIHKKYPKKRVEYVVLTNFHDDRITGAPFFKEIGAKIVAHKTIIDDIKDYNDKFERMAHILTKDELNGTAVVKPDIVIDNNYTIKGSKKSIELKKLSKVSEERSDIIVYSPKDSFIFAGNIVFNGRMLNYREASNVDGWIKALEQIAAIKAKYILGGHGAEYGAKSYEPSLKYLKIFRDNVKAAHKKEVDADNINIDKNPYIDIPYYKVLNRNNINHYYDQLDFE